MKLLLSKKMLPLAIIGILLVVLILKVTLFLTTKPKVTVDYLSRYNEMTRPQNYDPNKNAAPYFQKAFDVFVKMPDELWMPYTNWPTDFNDNEQVIFEKWLISNTLAFEYSKEALYKPYYWIKRTAQTDNYLTNNYLGGAPCSDLVQLKKITETLGWDAMFKASRGQFQSAFEDVIDCYQTGKYKCSSKLTFVEQQFGLNIKGEAVRNAFIVLDKSKVDSKAFKFLQDTLQREFDKDTFLPGCEAEKLYHYDTLQRLFLDDGKDTGRLWWRAGFGIVIPLADEGKILERKIQWSCFTGPTRKQVAEQIEQTATLFNIVMTKTPWQIKNEGRDYFKEMDDINKRYIFLKLYHVGIDPKGIYPSYYKTKSQTEALIAVLAILRHKTETGQLPESLDKLVSTGYLQSVPMDPYSNGSLVYKVAEDNFKLYSVGENFIDDDGEIKVADRTELPGMTPDIYSPDIIYWPVTELQKLRYEFIKKQSEKIKAEKAAKEAAMQKIPDPNRPK